MLYILTLWVVWQRQAKSSSELDHVTEEDLARALANEDASRLRSAAARKAGKGTSAVT